MSAPLYIALLHYPVHDKNRKLVATAVTNVDVHDIGRLAATYGLPGYFVVTPVEQQRALVHEMLGHWLTGEGAAYNPRRKQALELARVVANLADAVDAVREATGRVPVTIGTSAGPRDGMVSYPEMRRLLDAWDGPAILALGTGWGLEKQFQQSLDYHLAPIPGLADYNHLSVRSAAAIMVDRLLGREYSAGER